MVFEWFKNITIQPPPLLMRAGLPIQPRSPKIYDSMGQCRHCVFLGVYRSYICVAADRARKWPFVTQSTLVALLSRTGVHPMQANELALYGCIGGQVRAGRDAKLWVLTLHMNY